LAGTLPPAGFPGKHSQANSSHPWRPQYQSRAPASGSVKLIRWRVFAAGAAGPCPRLPNGGWWANRAGPKS